MTKSVKIAQKHLHSLAMHGNVAFAFVGGKHIAATLGSYCFADARRSPSPIQDLFTGSYPKTGGVTIYPSGMRTIETQDYFVLRLKADREGYYHIPVNKQQLVRFWKIVEQFLACFEPALLPSTMEERIANGIVVDLSKITMAGFGVLSVGYRNLYEKHRWLSIEALMERGLPFKKAFVLAQFFKIANEDTDPVWILADPGHTILENYTWGLSEKHIRNTVKDEFLLDSEYLFSGGSFKDTTEAWGNTKDWRCKYLGLNPEKGEYIKQLHNLVEGGNTGLSDLKKIAKPIDSGAGWNAFKAFSDEDFTAWLKKNKDTFYE